MVNRCNSRRNSILNVKLMRELIKFVKMYNYRKQNLYIRHMFFIYKLIKEKKINDLSLLKYYCISFYNSSNSRFYRSVSILEQFNFIIKRPSLYDSRKIKVFTVEVKAI